jgi:hypothetical protein
MRIPQSHPGFRNIELLGLFHRKRRPSTAIYRARFVPPVTSRSSLATLAGNGERPGTSERRLTARRRRARCSRRRQVPDGGLSALELEISGPCAVAVPPLSRLEVRPPRPARASGAILALVRAYNAAQAGTDHAKNQSAFANASEPDQRQRKADVSRAAPYRHKTLESRSWLNPICCGL